VHKNPQARFFKEPVFGPLKAVVCGSCGYVEFYVKNPGELTAASEEAKRK
jgi:hypothetical protein